MLSLDPTRLVSQYHDWFIGRGFIGGGNGFGGSSVGTLHFLSWPKSATEITPAQQQQPPDLSQAHQVQETSHSVLFPSILLQLKTRELKTAKHERLSRSDGLPCS